jgi:3-methyl-2-oxobutanoate hydroxymethyltransferase
MGLRPQAVGILGGYRYQGRTAREANEIVDLAGQMEAAGAAAVLLEAVPPEVSEAVVAQTRLPVIGCGAGPACHASVVVTYDLLGLTPRVPRFVTPDVRPRDAIMGALGGYVRDVSAGKYPGPEHQYAMPADAKDEFKRTGPVF